MKVVEHVQESKDVKASDKRVQMLFDGLWIRHKAARFFHILFIGHRFILVFALVLMVKRPLGQLFCYLALSLLQLIYQIRVKPHDCLTLNKLERMNEIFVLALAYHLPCISN